MTKWLISICLALPMQYIQAAFCVRPMARKAPSFLTTMVRQQQPVRQKMTLAALGDSLQYYSMSPHIRAVVAAALKDGSGNWAREVQRRGLATAFLNKPGIADPNVRFTIASGNPARYLTPALAGELLRLHNGGELYDRKRFFESETYRKWGGLYTGPEDEKGFAAQVRKLLNRMEQEPDKTKVIHLLASAVYYKGETPEDIDSFLKSAGAPSQEKVDALVREYGEVLSSLVGGKKDMTFLQASEGVPILGRRCGEKAIWSVLNALLYNEATGLLDLSKLSQTTKPSPEFVAFVKKYSNPRDPHLYSAAAQEFLDMVDTLPEVQYHSDNQEIPGDRGETLKIANKLLFSDAYACKSFQELAQKLSEGHARTVTFEEPSDPKYGIMKTEVVDSASGYVAKGEWGFTPGHVWFAFERPAVDKTPDELREIVELDAQMGIPGGLIKLVPGWQYRLIDWNLDDVADVKKWFSKVEATKEELRALVQTSDNRQQNLLHMALQNGRADLAQYFVEECGIDPRTPNSEGETPLMMACQALKRRESVVEYISHVLGLDPQTACTK